MASRTRSAGRSQALKFVLLVGVMSFFADFTYRALTAGYGIAWFLGSALMGVLYDMAFPALIVFSVVAELAAIPVLLAVQRAPAGIPSS
jgi:hypothetical protein